jgi:lipoprotein-anchoring transpeptidase ErfK/SrfK
LDTVSIDRSQRLNKKKGVKTMRRHVENQVDRPENDSLGILIFFALWAFALVALSVSAGAQEFQAHTATQPPTDSAQHPLSAKSNQSETSETERVADAAQQPDAADQITLTRFILISIPDRELALVDNGQVVKIYPIAVGAHHSPSPEGDFTIVSRVSNPTWSHKGKVVGPGKDNPVGSRWMGLSVKGYGIHGTNAPRSIGKAASHGCFRMGKKDVEELFTLVRVGDTVAVRAQRDELVTQVFDDESHTGEVQVASSTVAAGNATENGENR